MKKIAFCVIAIVVISVDNRCSARPFSEISRRIEFIYVSLYISLYIHIYIFTHIDICYIETDIGLYSNPMFFVLSLAF